jgi:hypothetical protein
MNRNSSSLVLLSAFFVFVLSWHASHAAFACTDSDGGRNHFVKGVAISNGMSQQDVCLNEFTLVEKYCSGSEIKWEHYKCPIGCSEGACASPASSVTGGFFWAPSVSAQSTPITLRVSRSPLKTISYPYKTGDLTTFTFSMSPWSWIKTNVLLLTLKSRDTDIATGRITENQDFIASMSDIIPMCNSLGYCSTSGTFTSGTLSCSGVDIQNTRKREEWIVINGVESNRNTLYFACSDTTSCTNECPQSGSSQCSANASYQTCGNYDSDSCLEWSSPTSCASGYSCSSGQCIQQPPPSCTNGETRGCGSSIGACRPGTQACSNGAWGSCTGGISPAAEICDGVDNDCDGQIDEGCQTPTCTDSDGGKNYYLYGIAQTQNSSGSLNVGDFCSGSTLYEAYCIGNYMIGTEQYSCPYGCSNGACIQTNQTCTDSDGGKNYYQAGGVTITIPYGPSSYASDFCAGGVLTESYCSNSELQTITYECPNGCSNGACIQEPQQLGGGQPQTRNTSACTAGAFRCNPDPKYPNLIQKCVSSQWKDNQNCGVIGKVCGQTGQNPARYGCVQKPESDPGESESSQGGGAAAQAGPTGIWYCDLPVVSLVPRMANLCG